MAQLRWILLVAGLIFIGMLLAWESRRGRARGDATRRGRDSRRDEHDIPTLHLPPPEAHSRGARTEPPFGDADALTQDDIAGEAPAGLMPPPDADTMADLSVTSGLRAVDAPLAAADFYAAADLRATSSAQGAAGGQGGTALEDGVAWHAQLGEGVQISDVMVREPPAPPQLPPPPALIVEWPPETERRIVSIQLVAQGADRFAGRALRQALAAAGFVHGRFGIYHLPAEDGRAVVSAASLSRPGILDPDNMDFQRFVGLNLFIVLPGALTAEASFECLVGVGAELAERLGGQLQDERGERLDTARAAQLRGDLLRTMTLPPPAAAAATQDTVEIGVPVSPGPITAANAADGESHA